MDRGQNLKESLSRRIFKAELELKFSSLSLIVTVVNDDLAIPLRGEYLVSGILAR